MSRDRAPILRDASRLHLWLHGRFEADRRPFARHLCGLTLALVDDLLLALRDRDRHARLERSD